MDDFCRRGVERGFMAPHASRTSKAGQRPPVTFNPALLGVGLFFVGVLVLVQNSAPTLDYLGAASASLLLRGLLLGSILMALLIIVLNRFTAIGRHIPSARIFTLLHLLALIVLLLVTGVLTYLVSTGILIGPNAPVSDAPRASAPLLPSAPTPSLPGVITLIGAGVLMGASLLPLLLAWGFLYACELPENALFHAAISLALASVLYPASALPFLRDVPLVFSCVLVISSSLIVLPAITSIQSTQNTRDTEPLDNERVEEPYPFLLPAHAPIPYRRVLRILWKPLLSGAISAFIAGLVWDAPTADVSSSAISLTALIHVTLAPIVATLLVIGAFFVRPRSFTLHIFNDVAMPVAIAILLVVPLFEFEGVDVSAFVGFLSQVCFAVVVLATWTSLSTGVRTLDERPWVVFALSSVIFAVAMLVGLFAIYVIGTGGRILCLVLLTLFLLLMVVDFALRERPQSSSRERMKEALEHYLQRHCDCLAKRHGLSTREREVFLYLARGYGQVYIAKELYVSENTVRTHTRHIYAKVGVSSREELLQLIDAEG
jgi:DNA-binding CsgD family transcriptional regulator